MVAESWFRGLWKSSRKHESGSEKELIGVLAFEVASLMSKLVHLWQSLSDKQVLRLREDISKSVGIKKLVSEDDDFIVGLIKAELIESMVNVVKSVIRLGKKCSDPGLKSFEHVFDELIKRGADPYKWEFTYGKMEKKVKKMERFISINASLYQEMEMLSDIEQTVKRMKGSDPEPENLLEYQKKLVWKQHEVKNLRQISLWNRTYDYTVRLLVRSLFTICIRIHHVFGVNLTVPPQHAKFLNYDDHIHQSQPLSAHLSAQPSAGSSIPRFSSGPLGGLIAKSKSKNTNNFYSGPLGGPTARAAPVSGKSRGLMFFSGPLGKLTTKSGPISGTIESSKNHSANLQGKKPAKKSNRLTQVGPFKGCMVATDIATVGNCYTSSTAAHLGRETSQSVPSPFGSQLKVLHAPPGTLGAAALALHYANVIVVIEKLAASPHLIGHDARDDLYNMLPMNVRTALRGKLKPYSKSLASAAYDSSLADEWVGAMSSILEWLAPLAHNMIRWQSERSFEQHSFVSRTNVLLVQTLYFANQEKTEATITELLVGLNYVWRFGRELNAKNLQECASGRAFDEFMELDK